MKNLYCIDCARLIAKLADGSSFHPKATHRCESCELKLQPRLSWNNQLEEQFRKTFTQKH